MPPWHGAGKLDRIGHQVNLREGHKEAAVPEGGPEHPLKLLMLHPLPILKVPDFWESLFQECRRLLGQEGSFAQASFLSRYGLDPAH